MAGGVTKGQVGPCTTSIEEEKLVIKEKLFLGSRGEGAQTRSSVGGGGFIRNTNSNVNGHTRPAIHFRTQTRERSTSGPKIGKNRYSVYATDLICGVE